MIFDSCVMFGIDIMFGIYLLRVLNLDRLLSDLVLNLFWKLD